MRSIVIFSLIASAPALLPSQTEIEYPTVVPIRSEEVFFIAPGATNIVEAGLKSQNSATLIYWADQQAESSSVYFRVLTPETWSIPVKLNADLTNATNLDAELSPTSESRFVWVESTPAGLNSLQFSTAGLPASMIMETPLAIDSVSLCTVDSKPVVAWSEGGAGVFASFFAVQEFDGWSIFPLSEELPSYDILPQVLNTTPPSVLWYSLEHSGFQLERLAQAEQEWYNASTAPLNTLPTQRLPFFFALPENELPGAFWIEPSSEGDQMRVFDPRILPEPFASLPKREGVQQLDPEVSVNALGDQSLAFAWVEETGADRYVIVQAGAKEYLISTIPAPRQPRLSWGSDSELNLVTLSDQSLGGTGQLYFTTILLRN